MADDLKELRRRRDYVRERLKELKSEQEKLKEEMVTLREKLGITGGEAAGRPKAEKGR
jgi:chaperonin cofactor prefoldin